MIKNKRYAQLIVAALLGLLASACGGTAPVSDGMDAEFALVEGHADGSTSIALDELLSDLAALPTPEGVDPASFGDLKAAMRQVLLDAGVERFALAVPAGEASQVTDVSLWSNGDGTASCNWTYRNQGDYDQNSEVNISDLSTIGLYLGRTVADLRWDPAALADGDLNGEVNIADITPIGQSIGHIVDGYYIETSPTEDPEGEWTLLATVPLETYSVQDGQSPRVFSWVVDAPEVGLYYRVVPYEGATRGIASTAAQYADDTPPALAVEKWKGGAQAAISLTFDDGTPDHWLRGLPLWEEYGFRVTLGIAAFRFYDQPERIPQLQEAFDAGHELANHTTTHQDLTSLTEEGILAELEDCESLLFDNVQGLTRLDTVVYPYETFDEDVMAVLEDKGYMFARSGPQGFVEYAPLNDAYDPPFLHLYSWANQDILPMWMWNSTTDWVLSHGDWLVEQCHGIGTAGEAGVGWSPRPESEFREHYNHIAAYGDQLWVAPVSEVGRYIVERNNARFSVLGYGEDYLYFIVYDGLTGTVFDVPLTITAVRPPAWPDARVRQGGVDVEHVEVDDGGQVLLRFDVTPGAGVVWITRE